jgi:hypothetical protein
MHHAASAAAAIRAGILGMPAAVWAATSSIVVACVGVLKNERKIESCIQTVESSFAAAAGELADAGNDRRSC